MLVNKKLYIDDNIGFVKLVSHSLGDLGLSVVNCARLAYHNTKDAVDEKDTKLIKFLWDNSHTSPFRHYFVTFHIKYPLFVARQWIKYQVGSMWRRFEKDGGDISIDVIDEMYDTDKGCSWNEVSGRYTQLKPEFYIPNTFRSNTKANKQASEVNKDLQHGEIEEAFKLHCDTTYQLYEGLIEEGVAKEQARMVLPQNIYSESYWTVSLQAVLHFLHQRLAPDAQYEIRMYAELIYKLVEPDLTKMGITRESILQ